MSSVKSFFAKWYERHLGNPESIVFILFAVFIFCVIYYLGNILLPLLIALVIAYLLERPVTWLLKARVSRTLSSTVIFILFLTFVILTLFAFIPILKNQLVSLINSLPDMFSEGKKLLIALKQEYPGYITEQQITDISDRLKDTSTIIGKYILSFSVASITNIVTVIIYLFLVPILVFLLLKDKDKLIAQVEHFMPEESSLIYRVLGQVHLDLGNYIRGRFLEAIIVGISTYLALLYFNLQYSALLSVLVAISVFFPYLGAIIVTIPLALVGVFQMGISNEFFQLMCVYFLLQIIDGNVLIPYLLSDALNMHPIYVLLAVILFGGLLGAVGVFFALPLAIVVKAVIMLWPSKAS